MKILHVWNMAGVSSLLAIYQRKLKHRVEVVQQEKHDNLGISQYYGDTLIKSKLAFLLYCIINARNYDLIHLHDAWFLVIPLRLLYPSKPVILHYHGSIVRNNYLGRLRNFLETMIDKIILATPDLLEYQYKKPPVYLPNPVDTKLFSKARLKKNNRCFSILKINDTYEHLKTILNDNDFDVNLTTLERSKQLKNLIDYIDFPNTLKEFEYYADIPFINDRIVRSYSMCGLQALSIGLKVINYDFQIVNSLPDYHKPENVVNQLERIYHDTLKNKKNILTVNQTVIVINGILASILGGMIILL